MKRAMMQDPEIASEEYVPGALLRAFTDAIDRQDSVPAPAAAGAFVVNSIIHQQGNLQPQDGQIQADAPSDAMYWQAEALQHGPPEGQPSKNAGLITSSQEGSWTSSYCSTCAGGGPSLFTCMDPDCSASHTSWGDGSSCHTTRSSCAEKSGRGHWLARNAATCRVPLVPELRDPLQPVDNLPGTPLFAILEDIQHQLGL